MNTYFDKLLYLQRFAEGGDGAGDGGDAGAIGQEAAAPVSPRARKSNPLANVKFGIQEDAVVSQTAPDTMQDEGAPAEETYESLIKGKFKADYDRDVQSIVQRRLKGSKAIEERLNTLAPVLQTLAERYGMDASDVNAIDVKALSKALSEDQELYEAEASREGMPVDLYMKAKQVERQQQAMQAQQRAMQEQAAARQEYASLLTQAVAFKAVNPSFNLDAEMENPAFGRMVLQPPHGSGVPIEAAYYAIHHKEIEQARRQQQVQVTQYAVQQTAEKTAKAIASGSRRPTENGVAKVAGADVRTDPRSLTKAERAEIKRRVRAGERIVW